MGELRPRISDIYIRGEMLASSQVWAMPDQVFAALSRLVWASAANMVWTYTEPDPVGALRDDDEILARLTLLKKRKWLAIRPEVEPFFRISDGKWILDRDWILIGVGTQRPSIPAGLRSMVMQRDKYRCVYCGTTDGPFDCDHVVPVSRGGENSLENLSCACASCNRSKGSKTPEEWLS